MKLITIGLVALSLLCSYIIMYVGLGYGWPLGTSDNYQRINTVLVNLSYSYMAGLIFFLFTSTLPRLMKKIKLAPIIEEKKAIIFGRLCECAKAPFTADEGVPKQFGKNELISHYVNRSVAEPCYYEIYTIEKYLRLQRTDIKETINGLLSYADILSVSDISLLEQVRDSQFFSQINVFQWEEMDTQEQRRKLAESLYEILELTESYKREK